jgi:spore maturation protein CgeB
MKIIMFYHSLLSDWNHGNAHFLRGIVTELKSRGHQVEVYEPENSWSLHNLLVAHTDAPIKKFKSIYKGLDSIRYNLESLDLNQALAHADLVIVHEWNEHQLVKKIGDHHAQSHHYKLLFHDTHHRCASDPESMADYDLSNYDGVLAYGNIIHDIYLKQGWIQQAWTWHEAADIRVFHPIEGIEYEGDLVWIGNWGDEERTAELYEFLIEPVKALGIRAKVYGVRYPKEAIAALESAGIEYAGWLPNYEVPQVFSRYRLTIHIPRRYYVTTLPGIPTIRVFEALACGIPLISAPWKDTENLFTAGKDFLIAQTGEEMQSLLKELLQNETLSNEIAWHGYKTILSRHTCVHRVDELLKIYEELVIVNS